MDSFADYLINDMLGHIHGLTSRKMFGGYGLYKDGVIFGMIVEENLYFKSGAVNKADFAKHNSQPFSYEGRGKIIETSYYQVPSVIYEDRDEVEKWVDKAVTASIESKKK